MNKEIEKIIKERNLHPIAYRKIKSVYVVNSKNNEYVIKLNTNNYDIYKYLISRDFLFFPENLSYVNDNYDISVFIPGLNTNNVQKLNDYVKIISLLHHKTSYKREIDLDEIKEEYESINNKIINLKNYYLELNERINHELFLSPSHYLLVRNISLIYSILDNTQILLNDVYQKLKDDKSIRVSLLHNNVDLEHLIVDESEYLISWDKAYFNNPIYEIENIYRKYYRDIDLNDLLKIYETINKINDLERKFLLVNLSIPNKIELTSNTFSDTKTVNNEIKYLNKVYELLIKYKNDDVIKIK